MAWSEPTPDQLELIEEHVLAFAESTRDLGVELSQMRRLVEPGHLAETLSVHEVYDQTPGRGAGAAL